MTTRILRNACRQPADTLLLDLDHTVVDWTRGWAEALRAMTGVLSESGVDEDQIHRELRDCHRRHGSTEVASALDELAGAVGGTTRAALRRAAAAYEKGWQQTPLRYRGVRGTLATLRRRGCRIIGYTESASLPTASRLWLSGVLEAFDLIVCTAVTPPSIGGPLRLRPLEHRPSSSQMRVAPWWAKGHARSLPDLLHAVGARAERTLVVGDHLDKDVGAARRAGIRAAWARYGTVRRDADYALLRRLAHWIPDDAARAPGITPSPADGQVESGTQEPAPVLTLDRFELVQDIAEWTRGPAVRRW